jgi:hypothetical protein
LTNDINAVSRFRIFQNIKVRMIVRMRIMISSLFGRRMALFSMVFEHLIISTGENQQAKRGFEPAWSDER